MTATLISHAEWHSRLPQSQPTSTVTADVWSLEACLQRVRDIRVWAVEFSVRPTQRQRLQFERRAAHAFHACQLGFARLALAHERRETATTLIDDHARRQGPAATPAQEGLLRGARQRADELLRDSGLQHARSRAQFCALMNLDPESQPRLVPLTHPPQPATLAALFAQATGATPESRLHERYTHVRHIADLAEHFHAQVLNHHRRVLDGALMNGASALNLLRAHERYFDARENHLALLARSWIETVDLRLFLAELRLPPETENGNRAKCISGQQIAT